MNIYVRGEDLYLFLVYPIRIFVVNHMQIYINTQKTDIDEKKCERKGMRERGGEREEVVAKES